jgi:N4-gp56 family major capsid protein
MKHSRDRQGLNWERMERASGAMVPAVLLFVEILIALGSSVWIGLQIMMMAAGLQSSGLALNDGFSPTSMQSGNTPQAALTTHYNRTFMENLKANVVMLRMCTRMPMPAHAGQIFRNFMLEPLNGNTVQATEGTVGSGITVTTNYQDYQLGQWADFLNIADKAFITSISDDLVNYEREMAYRLGLSVDNLVMAFFDYLRTLDSKTANNDVLTGNYQMTKQQIEQVPFSLLGQNVKPMDRGYFVGKIHPFFVGDLMALDNSNNSVVDILKHTPEGLLKLEELPDGPEGDEVKYIELMGVRWFMSTNCTQSTTSAVAVASGLTSIRSYVAGKDAIVAIKLDRPDRTQIDDGNYKNMTLWRGEYKPGNVADPAGVVGAGTSYNTIMAYGVPPDPTSRARCWDAVPQTT